MAYKPKILIGCEETHYEAFGEPYWLMRFAGDNYTPTAKPLLVMSERKRSACVRNFCQSLFRFRSDIL